MDSGGNRPGGHVLLTARALQTERPAAAAGGGPGRLGDDVADGGEPVGQQGGRVLAGQALGPLAGDPLGGEGPDGVGQHRTATEPVRVGGQDERAARADELERGGLRLAAVRAQDGGGVDLSRAALGRRRL